MPPHINSISDREALCASAASALETGSEQETIPALEAYLAEEPNDVVMLHWLAMLNRALDQRENAIGQLSRALKLEPQNAAALHALAHVTLEAGGDASKLFERAIALTPEKPDLRLGLASARLAEGDGERGLNELRAALAANPGWMEGHRGFAQLATYCGQPAGALSTLEEAAAKFPNGGDLYISAITLLLDGERYQESLVWIERAIAQFGEADSLLQAKAGALDELGQIEEAAALFARCGHAQDMAHTVRRQRHLLRIGEASQAAQELEPWIAADQMTGLWPYAGLAWRLTEDPRYHWLEREDFIQTFELSPSEVDFQALTELLHMLHGKSGRFMDQSVRGGTQTDGNLLARCEQPIVALRHAFRSILAEYRARLPQRSDWPGINEREAIPRHPLLDMQPKLPVRFAGAWSVRLANSGHHSYHHHPQGWVSSALYVTVPETLEPQQGQLHLGGSPADLGLNLEPLKRVTPRGGQLTIFPSTMWHGTTPFDEGERMTVAFDVKGSAKSMTIDG